MGQRIGILGDWVALREGQVLKLVGNDDMRKIVLQCNAPFQTVLYVSCNGSPQEFLARVEGRDDVEFYARGELQITSDGDTINIRTSEFLDTWVIEEAPESFTVVAVRKARNPELERMMYMQAQNMERRVAMMRGETERAIYAAMEEGRRALAAERASARSARDDAAPEPAKIRAGAAGGKLDADVSSEDETVPAKGRKRSEGVAD